MAGAAVKFLGVFAITQVPLAVGEGFLGVLLFRVLTVNARPELERLGVLTPRTDEPDEVSREKPREVSREKPREVSREEPRWGER